MPVYFPSSASGLPNVYNFSPGTNLTKWRAALARVKSAQGNARILCIGDSTTMGVGTGSSTTAGNFKPSSYPTQLAGRLNAVGINAHWNSFSGYGNVTGSTPNNAGNDSRITMGSAWTAHTFDIAGGAYLKASTNTNALSFTPTVNVDTFKVIYPVGAFGKFQIDINGGAATVVDESVGTTFATATITGTLGSNTLNIKWNTGGTVYIVAVEAYDSSKNWVSVMNAGWSGAKATNVDEATVITSYPWLTQDLTLLNCGINDWNFGPTSITTYTSQMQAVITACLATGDVVLITPTPSNPGSFASVATQQTFITAMYGLAAANNLCLIDNWARWQSYTASNTLGLYFDGVHPNAKGYSDQAQAIANVIGAP